MSQASTITEHIYNFHKKINCTPAKPVIDTIRRNSQKLSTCKITA